jgi:predicted SprT family Zn-dependent metalloprotease
MYNFAFKIHADKLYRTKQKDKGMSITKTEYAGLEQAYNFFNDKLFKNNLPPCLITFQKKARCYGYFFSNRFSNRLNTNTTADEIALNPDQFKGRSDLEILSTLVHEMVHLHQAHFGKPSRGGYHNKEWAKKMESIGLMPSDTAKPGGKRTGQRVSHYIIEGGQFGKSTEDFLSKGFKLNWEGNINNDDNGAKGKNKNKAKFTCLGCKQNAWAKPKASLICGICKKVMKSENVN